MDEVNMSALAFFCVCVALVCLCSRAYAGTAFSGNMLRKKTFTELPVPLVMVCCKTLAVRLANTACKQEMGVLLQENKTLYDMVADKDVLQQLKQDIESFEGTASAAYSVHILPSYSRYFISLVMVEGQKALLSIIADDRKKRKLARVLDVADDLVAIDAVFLLDSAHCLINCSEGFARLFGSRREELIGKTLAGLIGTTAATRFLRAANEESELQRMVYLEDCLFPCGRRQRLELTRIGLVKSGGRAEHILGLCNSTETIRCSSEEVRERNRLLAIVRSVVQLLLSDSASLNEKLTKVLGLLGHITGVQRVTVWRYAADEKEISTITPVALWREDSSESDEGTQQVVFKKDARVNGWKVAFAAGQCVTVNAEQIPLPLRKLFSKNAVSVCVVPILLHNTSWGSLVFESNRHEQHYTPDEDEVLRTTGSIIGAAFSVSEFTAALKHSNKLFRDVVAATGEIIWETDADGRLVFISDRCVNVFGLEPEELIGRTLRDIAGSDEFFEEFDAHVKQQLAHKKIFRHVEHRVIGADKKTHYFRSSGAPTFDTVGTVCGLRGSSSDISKEVASKKLLESALAAVKIANEELEQYVQLAHELAARAEAANQVKSEFFANIGHEVRTPINIINGMAHLALRSGLTPQQQEYIRKVQNAGVALMDILNNIIDVASMTGDTLHFDMQSFLLRDTIESAIASLEPIITSKGLSVTVDFDSAIPNEVVGDAARLGQIFKNLVHNGVKFTEQGGVAVQCKCRHKTATAVTLECRVADTGIGVAQSLQDNLFRPFYQADGSSTRRYGGTGVGLALTKCLVEAMQGTISLYSEEGKGTMVVFSLVLKLSEKSAPVECIGKQLEDIEVHYTQMPDVSGCSVLVLLDDSFSQQQIVVDQMREIGLQPVFVTSIDSAIELLDKTPIVPPFDLVFLMLPHSHKQLGHILARVIRSRDEYRHMPIIRYCFCGKESNVCECQLNGMQGCIPPGLSGKSFKFRVACLIDYMRQQQLKHLV